jgi:hypothetical protein
VYICIHKTRCFHVFLIFTDCSIYQFHQQLLLIVTYWFQLFWEFVLGRRGTSCTLSKTWRGSPFARHGHGRTSSCPPWMILIVPAKLRGDLIIWSWHLRVIQNQSAVLNSVWPGGVGPGPSHMHRGCSSWTFIAICQDTNQYSRQPQCNMNEALRLTPCKLHWITLRVSLYGANYFTILNCTSPTKIITAKDSFMGCHSLGLILLNPC